MFLLNPFFNRQQANPALTLALLHFDGSNGSTVFTDSSPYNKTITINSGTPTNSSDNAEVGFGNRGKFFSGDSIKVLPTSNDFNLAFNDNFTLEARFEVSSLGGYRDWETDRKSTRLNSSHSAKSRMPSSA